ncbi:hypothetical protein IWX65_001163 [Arthrobacter sp. CAN_A214]|uniref:hypothetical protein n=1 Tax=Arthrobacter sp. CAN_A214 TaxID=2787720 RepID=UPI0018CBC8D6
MPSHPSAIPLTLMSSLVVRKALDGGVLSAYEQVSGSSLRTEYPMRVFSVAVGSGAVNRHAAESLVRHLTGPSARAAYAATGLQNLHPGAQGEIPQQ